MRLAGRDLELPDSKFSFRDIKKTNFVMSKTSSILAAAVESDITGLAGSWFVSVYTQRTTTTTERSSGFVDV